MPAGGSLVELRLTLLLALTTTHAPATDLGYLLAKNPARLHAFDLAIGNVYVFYGKRQRSGARARFPLQSKDAMSRARSPSICSGRSHSRAPAIRAHGDCLPGAACRTSSREVWPVADRPIGEEGYAMRVDSRYPVLEACAAILAFAFVVARPDAAAAQTADKVTVCHIPPGNPANAHTISVDAAAVPAHLGHGDTLTPCEVCLAPGEVCGGSDGNCCAGSMCSARVCIVPACMPNGGACNPAAPNCCAGTICADLGFCFAQP